MSEHMDVIQVIFLCSAHGMILCYVGTQHFIIFLKNIMVILFHFFNKENINCFFFFSPENTSYLKKHRYE